MEELAHQHVVQSINPIFGQIGHFFIITAFICSIFAAVYYFLSTQAQQRLIPNDKLKIARIFFIGHLTAIVGVVVTLFIMIFNHHFEYYYVWSHSSSDLQMKYVLSCFWEGQEEVSCCGVSGMW